MSACFSLLDVNVFLGGVQVLHSISLRFAPGECVAIVGPNGAGKSTLLSVLAGLRVPDHGACSYLNREVVRWPRREYARHVAVVQQMEPLDFPFTAWEIVAMGRAPHRANYFENAADRDAIEGALSATSTTHLSARRFDTLSGGERQSVLLASALAQAPEVLLLDEPGTHLDLRHQIALHHKLRDLAAAGLLVVAVTHDLNMAARFTDRCVVLEQGRVRADGSPAQVLDTGLIAQVFGVQAEVHHQPSGSMWLSYGG